MISQRVSAVGRSPMPRGARVLLAGTATGEIYATEDKGASWQLLTDQATPVSKEDHHIPFISEKIRRETLAARGD